MVFRATTSNASTREYDCKLCKKVRDTYKVITSAHGWFLYGMN